MYVCVLCIRIIIWAGWSKYKSPESYPMYTVKMCIYTCIYQINSFVYVHVSCVICIDIYICMYICALCTCIQFWADWSKYKSPKSYPVYTLRNVYVYVYVLCMFITLYLFHVYVSCVICIHTCIYIYICMYVYYVYVLWFGPAGRSISLPNHTLCIPCKMCLYMCMLYLYLSN